ncbi:MAG: EFR1 family ferrodoxin [Peptostreptococcaceae bacterium]|nr:EFR1 family ferrodoxin [Peptostreptococcaceae bacterium]
MFNKINALYFSGTGTTRKVVLYLVESLTAKIEEPVERINIDFSLPEARIQSPCFTEKDLVIVGIPVYAGRVPNILLKYLNSVKGNGAQAVAVVLYGNRNFDDSLIELTDILSNNSFKVVAAGAFIGEHSFSKILAQGRPDKDDMKEVENFARDIYGKINRSTYFHELLVSGQKPYRNYYQPKDRLDNSFDFRVISPHTKKDVCIDCKNCAEICPVGSISYDDTSVMNGICIKCCACIKGCPVEAKYFDNENYKKHQHDLEKIYTERLEPETFI